MTKQRARYYEISPGIFSPLNDGETGPSERATPKTAGPAKVVAAVSTGSLPVSSVLDLAARYENMANSYEECGAHFMAATYRDIALDIRAVAGCATERQPEENHTIGHTEK